MSGFRILVVEDDPGTQRALGRALTLRLSGYRHELRLVATQRDALEALTSAPFDVVLSDWSFPDQHAGGVFTGAGAAVVAHCKAAGIPVLVMSGDERPRSFDGPWLVKPADLADIWAFVAENLGIEKRA